MKTKTCKDCKKTLARSLFHKHNKKYDIKHHNVPPEKNGKSYGDGLHPRCKECRKIHRKRYDNYETSRRYSLKRSFGITPEDYDRMFKEQGGVCKICSAPPETCYKGVLYVDHDHSTGAVRGLLCSACNCGIGYLRDNWALCDKASAYLQGRI